MALLQTARGTAPRRSQAERRDESERLLVEATLKVVAEQGVGAATFEEIGKEAGLSRGLATQRFGSKRGLVEAVIAYLHKKREAIMQAEHVDEIAAFDAIARFVDDHLRALKRRDDGRAYWMLLAATIADRTPLRDLFAASHERVRVRLRGLLERGRKKGEIRRDVDCDAMALAIGSLLFGVSMQRLVDPQTDIEAIRTTIMASLRRALLPGKGER